MGGRSASLEGLVVAVADAFRGRRVFVTGHTGFKGAWLTLWLKLAGARVTGYALDPPSAPSLFDLANVGDGIDDRRGDILDQPALETAIAESNPEFVFHLAAQSLVRRGFAQPVATFATNVVGTAAVLEACRDAPSLVAFVCVTSDKCYENRDWTWGYRENDRLGGYDPYSSSKACAELVTDAFRRSYFDGLARDVGIATARAGNVIGGGDWGADRLVPDLVRAAAARNPVGIRFPHAIRPWQHVLEPLAGYLTLARRLAEDPRAFSGAWNFGPSPDATRAVAEVVGYFEQQWSPRLRWRVDDANHPHEARRLVLDSTKAHAELGWAPRLAIDEALAFTASWYEAYLQGDTQLRDLTERQIADYCGHGIETMPLPMPAAST